MRHLDRAEIEAALVDTLHRLWRARENENLDAEMVYEAQLDRLIRWWQQTVVGVPVAEHPR